MIAVVGILFPDADHSAFYITDFCVKPDMKNKGLGSMVLAEILKMHQSKQWRAFIDENNPQALQFFQKNGWKLISNEPDEHGMIEVEFHLQ